MFYKIYAVIILVVFMGNTWAADNTCGFSAIPDDKIKHDCGCSYGLDGDSSGKLFFQSDFGFDDPDMYLENMLVKVKPLRDYNMPVEAEIGQKFNQHYHYKDKKHDLRMSFKNVISFVCPDEAEGCETTAFKATVNIVGSCNTELRFEGRCGC